MIKENLNEIAGVVDKNEGGILDENQVRNILGEPNEETNGYGLKKRTEIKD